jgi:ATP-dependent Lhr-like helicase
VRGKIDKTLVIDTLIPPDPGKYSWAGHLGARMQQPVVEEIERSGTTLVFTNVRSQAEIWYQLLLEARPEWAGTSRCTTARWTGPRASGWSRA